MPEIESWESSGTSSTYCESRLLTSGFRGRKLGSLSGPPLGAQAPGAPEEDAEVLRYFAPFAYGGSARDSLGRPGFLCVSLWLPWVRLPLPGCLGVSVSLRVSPSMSVAICWSLCVSLGFPGSVSLFVGLRRCPCLSVVVSASL